MKRKKIIKKSGKELKFTLNVEIYDKQNNLVNIGVLTYSLGTPKLDIPQIDRKIVTPWVEE